MVEVRLKKKKLDHPQNAGFFLNQPLVDLHFHLGQSVDPHLLWSIAHEQGIRLPSKNYWDFYNLTTLNQPHVTWRNYHQLFALTELIQSSPQAMERSIYETVVGAYLKNNITLMEPGFCPMLRNRGGERDLDQIILATLYGMEKALIEFPNIKAGLIFMLDRRLSYEKNKIIVKKAIKYKNRGIIGIDIAGPNTSQFNYSDYVSLFHQAQEAGLKTTIHTGEDGSITEMEHVINTLPLNRINHGIKSVESKSVMKSLVKKNITLCLCPSSNMAVGFVKDTNHLKTIVQTLWKNQVKFCFNTDNPSMLRTNITNELNIILNNNILTKNQINQTIRWAFESTFINLKNNHENLYL